MKKIPFPKNIKIIQSEVTGKYFVQDDRGTFPCAYDTPLEALQGYRLFFHELKFPKK